MPYVPVGPKKDPKKKLLQLRDEYSFDHDFFFDRKVNSPPWSEKSQEATPYKTHLQLKQDNFSQHTIQHQPIIQGHYVDYYCLPYCPMAEVLPQKVHHLPKRSISVPQKIELQPRPKDGTFGYGLVRRPMYADLSASSKQPVQSPKRMNSMEKKGDFCGCEPLYPIYAVGNVSPKLYHQQPKYANSTEKDESVYYPIYPFYADENTPPKMHHPQPKRTNSLQKKVYLQLKPKENIPGYDLMYPPQVTVPAVNTQLKRNHSMPQKTYLELKPKAAVIGNDFFNRQLNAEKQRLPRKKEVPCEPKVELQLKADLRSVSPTDSGVASENLASEEEKHIASEKERPIASEEEKPPLMAPIGSQRRKPAKFVPQPTLSEVEAKTESWSPFNSRQFFPCLRTMRSAIQKPSQKTRAPAPKVAQKVAKTAQQSPRKREKPALAATEKRHRSVDIMFHQNFFTTKYALKAVKIEEDKEFAKKLFSVNFEHMLELNECDRLVYKGQNELYDFEKEMVQREQEIGQILSDVKTAGEEALESGNRLADFNKELLKFEQTTDLDSCLEGLTILLAEVRF